MRSGISFFNWPVFKKTVLRYWPVWGAYSVIWLVALPLQGLMMLQLDASNRRGGGTPYSTGYMQNFARHTVPNMTSLALVLAVVFGALCAMAVCSHLYNARSANFFGSLPVKREGLFITHYLAGLAFLIVPNAAIFLLTLLVESISGTVFLPGLGFWLAAACGECLFFYSMAVFCGMFTGHILALPAFYGIFNVLAAGVYFLVEAVFRQFYYGFTSFGSALNEVVGWLTPLRKLNPWTVELWFTETGYEARGLGEVAVYAVAAVVLAVCSFLLYRARRLESAGDVVSVKCMRPVFQYGVAFCAGLALGTFTTAFLGGEEPTLMVSILIWAVIGYFVARMLLEKSFRVLRYWKGAAVSAGVFVLLFLVVGFDLTGFETRVPTADQVDYVEFNGIRVCRLNDGGDYYHMYEKNTEIVDYAILLHQAAVDQRDSRPTGTTARIFLNLTYRLKNGGELSRYYDDVWIDPSQVDQEGSTAWAIQQLYDDRELYWKGYGFERAEELLSEEGWRLQEVTYEYEDYSDAEREGRIAYYGGADARALYEAVKEDFHAGRIGVRRVEDWDKDTYDRRNLTFSFAGGEDGSWSIDIRVQDTASSTLAVLERLGTQEDGEPAQDPSSAGVPDTEAGYPAMEPVPTAEPVE